MIEMYEKIPKIGCYLENVSFLAKNPDNWVFKRKILHFGEIFRE